MSKKSNTDGGLATNRLNQEDAKKHNRHTDKFEEAKRLLTYSQCGNHREYGDSIGKDDGGRSAQITNTTIVTNIGQSAAEDAQEEEQQNHLRGPTKLQKSSAVEAKHQGQIIKGSKKVLIGSDGEGAVMIHNLDQHQSIGHGDGHGAREKAKALVRTRQPLTHDHDRDAQKREQDAQESDRANTFVIDSSHAERDKNGDGCHDDRGEASAYEVDAGGFHEIIDKRLTESEQEKPLDVGLTKRFELAKKEQRRNGYEGCEKESKCD